jgi:hypothetical protein
MHGFMKKYFHKKFLEEKYNRNAEFHKITACIGSKIQQKPCIFPANYFSTLNLKYEKHLSAISCKTYLCKKLDAEKSSSKVGFHKITAIEGTI